MICECGNNKCKGLCKFSIGKRLVQFIKEVEFIETNIGELDKSGNDTLVNVGTKLFKDGEASKILRGIGGEGIHIKKRFNKIDDSTTLEIANEYLCKSGDTDKNRVIEYIRKFETNKLMLVPIKIGTLVSMTMITVRERDGKEIKSKYNVPINAIKWVINHETGELEGSLIGSYTKDGRRRTALLRIDEYGKTYNIVDLEVNRTNSKGYNIIKMSEFGYVYPIEFRDEKQSVIVDNCNVYLCEEAEVKAIGKWKDNSISIVDKDVEITKKIRKAIEDNTRYILRHRKFIAPYVLCDTNEVAVK